MGAIRAATGISAAATRGLARRLGAVRLSRKTAVVAVDRLAAEFGDDLARAVLEHAVRRPDRVKPTRAGRPTKK